MNFEDKKIVLKDGRQALLRTVKPKEDAESMLEYLKAIAAETPFIMRTPEECEGMTVEKEEGFLNYILSSDDQVMIVCEVEGENAGNCTLSFNSRAKTHHTASVAIGLYKKFWNLGIGTAMFEAMTEIAKRRDGVEIMELEFITGNDRARALYEKAGFTVICERPDVILQPDGTKAGLIYMQKRV